MGNRPMMRRGTIPDSGQAYYSHLERGFDDLAPTYDKDIAANEVTIRMRKIFRKALSRPFIPDGDSSKLGAALGLTRCGSRNKGSMSWRRISLKVWSIALRKRPVRWPSNPS